MDDKLSLSELLPESVMEGHKPEMEALSKLRKELFKIWADFTTTSKASPISRDSSHDDLIATLLDEDEPVYIPFWGADCCGKTSLVTALLGELFCTSTRTLRITVFTYAPEASACIKIWHHSRFGIGQPSQQVKIPNPCSMNAFVDLLTRQLTVAPGSPIDWPAYVVQVCFPFKALPEGISFVDLPTRLSEQNTSAIVRDFLRQINVPGIVFTYSTATFTTAEMDSYLTLREVVQQLSQTPEIFFALTQFDLSKAANAAKVMLKDLTALHVAAEKKNVFENIKSANVPGTTLESGFQAEPRFGMVSPTDALVGLLIDDPRIQRHVDNIYNAFAAKLSRWLFTLAGKRFSAALNYIANAIHLYVSDVNYARGRLPEDVLKDLARAAATIDAVKVEMKKLLKELLVSVPDRIAERIEAHKKDAIKEMFKSSDALRGLFNTRGKQAEESALRIIRVSISRHIRHFVLHPIFEEIYEELYTSMKMVTSIVLRRSQNAILEDVSRRLELLRQDEQLLGFLPESANAGILAASRRARLAQRIFFVKFFDSIGDGLKTFASSIAGLFKEDVTVTQAWCTDQAEALYAAAKLTDKQLSELRGALKEEIDLYLNGLSAALLKAFPGEIMAILQVATEEDKINEMRLSLNRLEAETECARTEYKTLMDVPADQRGFELQEEFAAGGFGVVRKAMHNGQPVIAKLPKTEMDGGATGLSRAHPLFVFYEEIHSSVSCRGADSVIQFTGLIKPTPDTWALLLPVFDANLDDHLDTHKDDDLALRHIMLIQVANAILEMHKRGLIHKDVSPRNIFIRYHQTHVAEVVLGDLGSTTDSYRGVTGFNAGIYTAPEQRDTVFSNSVDVYSFGAVMERCLVPTSFPAGWNGTKPTSDHLIALLAVSIQCKKFNPNDRPAMEEVAKMLTASYVLYAKLLPQLFAAAPSGDQQPPARREVPSETASRLTTIVQRQPKAAPSNAAASSSNQPAIPSFTLRDCIVCLTDPRSVRFNPCSHAVCCLPCGLRVMSQTDPKCPFCHGAISSYDALEEGTQVQTFMPRK